MNARSLGIGGAGLLTSILAIKSNSLHSRGPASAIDASQDAWSEAKTPGTNDQHVDDSSPSFVGVLILSESVEVSAEVSGTIRTLNTRIGETVAKGSLLGRINEQGLRAELRAARVAFKHAVSTARRTGELARVGAVSTDEASNAEVAVAAHRARLRAAEAALARVEIRAPIDGVISARYAEEGASIAAGQPLFKVLHSSTNVRVRFAIPEETETNPARGDSVWVVIESPHLILEATVEEVAGEIDAASRMTFATARVTLGETNKNQLRSGKSIRVLPARPENDARGSP